MEVAFVTGNAGKVTTPKRILAEYGIEVVQHSPERDEPKFTLDEYQYDTAQQIAVRKAEDAYAVLGKPLFVVDSAFHIPKFDGWPGPLVKQAIHGIGPEGFCKLMWEIPWADRVCYFEDVIVFTSYDLTIPRCFSRRVFGVISPEPRGSLNEKQKSRLFQVFIPDDSPNHKTLAQMTDEEMRGHSDNVSGLWHDFARWLKS